MVLASLCVAFLVNDNAFSLPPILGDLTTESVRILCKPTVDTSHQLRVYDSSGVVFFQSDLLPRAASDHSLTWHVVGLEAGQRYDYSIALQGSDDFLATSSFTTQADTSEKLPVSIGFASCADESPETDQVWRRMRLEKTDAVVLLGDTPYIDTTDLSVQRRRYKDFGIVPGFSDLASGTPVYSTWDDHDFGLNDTDGRLPGKENSRQAFLESRPNPSAGEHDQGIYTNFQIGDIEVFLLDARWFARTEQSTFAPEQPSLLGKQQWSWLRTQLSESTATWKVVTTGMIFNSAVRPLKHDYWSAYPAELNGLFEMLGELRLSGVILMGGDIHRQRVVRHATGDIVGYDLIELISSPAHAKIIDSANQPHSGLLFDGGEAHVWIDLRSDPNAVGGPALQSRILRASGEVLDLRTWALSDFTPEVAKAPQEP